MLCCSKTYPLAQICKWLARTEKKNAWPFQFQKQTIFIFHIPNSHFYLCFRFSAQNICFVLFFFYCCQKIKMFIWLAKEMSKQFNSSCLSSPKWSNETLKFSLKTVSLLNKCSWAAIMSAYFFEARHGFTLHERVKWYFWDTMLWFKSKINTLIRKLTFIFLLPLLTSNKNKNCFGR